MAASFSRKHFIQTLSVATLAGMASKETLALPSNSPNKNLPGKTPHTRFAINTEIWWSKLDLADRIKKAAEYGFPAIEFWSLDGKNVDEVARTCKNLGLEIAQFTAWGFKPGLNELKNHDLFEQKIKEACAAAKTMNCKLATVVGGDDVPGMTQEQMHANIITGLKRVKPIIEDNDLTLILEPMNIRVNHKGHSLYGSTPAIHICEEVNSPNVKINWDLYHMQITEGDLCGHLRDGFKYVGYLQVADNPGRNEPGTGEINYSRVLKQAYDLGYRGYVGLECWPLEGEEKAMERVNKADQW